MAGGKKIAIDEDQEKARLRVKFRAELPVGMSDIDMEEENSAFIEERIADEFSRRKLNEAITRFQK